MAKAYYTFPLSYLRRELKEALDDLPKEGTEK